MVSPEQDRLSVERRSDEQRYVLLLDDDIVGLADFSARDGVVTIPHVETIREHRGKDFAARLMRGVLDDVRERGETVRPLCPYAAAYMRRHPETNDLLAERS